MKGRAKPARLATFRLKQFDSQMRDSPSADQGPKRLIVIEKLGQPHDGIGSIEPIRERADHLFNFSLNRRGSRADNFVNLILAHFY
jgi:hypothetical protein